ncbi:MAG: NYN domain-containing protein [Clostridiaceae bacterium]
MKHIFLDGYNIINNWPELKVSNDEYLQSSREKLIEKMRNYAAFIGCKVFIVFDAHLTVGGLEKKERYDNVVVVFTKEGETADAYIERNVNDLGRRRDILVVTNDNLEQQTVFQRGAMRMSSIEFYHEIKTIELKITDETAKISKRRREWIEDRLDKETLIKLEKIRRSE